VSSISSQTIWSPHSIQQQDVLLSKKPMTIAATGIQWGKGVHIDTPILTIEGYKPAKNITMNDVLIDRDGKPTLIKGIYPQGYKLCYLFELTDRKSFVVDESHLHVIKRRGYAKEEIISTKDLFKRKSIWEGKSKPQIPALKPIKFDEKKYYISPYVMGVLIGDGGLTSSVILSSIDSDLVDRVRNELPEGFIAKKKTGLNCDYTIINEFRKTNDRGHGVNKVKSELKRLGLWGCKSEKKFIPNEYKLGSIEQRVQLLNGLMDTDGTVGMNSKMEFFTVSLQLANDVIYLVESLGGKAWATEKPTTHQLCYRVNIISPFFNPFWIERKASKYFIHKNTPNKLIKNIQELGYEETICFEVESPTKTFVIKGQVVTHNTTVGVMRLKMFMHQFTNRDDNFIVTSPTYKILYQSTLPPFLLYNDDIGKYDKKNECFRIKGGGIVWFRTGTDPDSVVGITNVRHILCDEAGKYGLYFWENIQGRSAFMDAGVTVVTSPYSLNWLYKDYIRKFQMGDEYIMESTHLCQAKSSDNPYFPIKSYEEKRRTMEPRRFNMMFGGKFDKAQGLVYDCFDAQKFWIDPIALPAGTKFFAGIDWGYTHPFVIVVRAITPLGLHYQVDEVYKTQLRLNEKIDEAHKMLARYPIEKFFADPANPDDISSFNQHGIRTVSANNDITKGIEEHWELINSGRYFMFRGTNKYTADEYELYHYPEEKDLNPDQDTSDKDERPVDQDNHCIAEESFIYTSRGLIPIEQIILGDFVRTRNGFNRVLNAWCSSENAKIVCIVTVKGKRIRCTYDHKIFTENRGFVKASNLKYNDILISIGEKKWKQLLGKIKDTEDIPIVKEYLNKGILSVFQMVNLFTYTVKCGSQLTVKYLQDFIYIISTAIRPIMKLKILNALVRQNMQENIREISRKRENTFQKSIISQKNGILVKRALNYIKGSVKFHQAKKYLLIRNAKSAALFLKRCVWIKKTNFAVINVDQSIEEKAELIISNPLVKFVKNLSSKINTASQELVEDSVLYLYEEARTRAVYDLTVENEHEFFTDGILVSNCMDANRYVTMGTSFIGGSLKKKIISSRNKNIIPTRKHLYDLEREKLLSKKNRNINIL